LSGTFKAALGAGEIMAQSLSDGRMKKVYSSVWVIGFLAGVGMLGVWLSLPWWVPALFLAGSIWALYFLVQPLFCYDEEIIVVNHVFKSYEHPWEEVTSIETTDWWANMFPLTWISFKNGGELTMGAYTTRAYTATLRDLVHTALKKNPAIQIDASTKHKIQ
jgi:hypothetical protein